MTACILFSRTPKRFLTVSFQLPLRGSKISQVHQSSRSSISLFNSDEEKSNAEYLNDLEEVSHRISGLLGGKSINVNSPKQVSTALFGKVQSTSRSVLEKLASGNQPGVNSLQQELATLVLRHRELSSPTSLSQNSTPLPQRGVSSVTPSDTFPSSTVEGILKEGVESSRIQKVMEDDELSSYERCVAALFEPVAKRGVIDPLWKDHLLQISRPSAQALVEQLNPTICPMGYDPLAQPFDPLRRTDIDQTTATTTAGKKGSFLAYCREQKEKYPDCVILVRCGDFYEAFGIDAILLVEHCGLNPMAGKARAGCPIRNIQATLDGLTEQGFRVAVFEEGTDTDASRGVGATGGAKSRIKSRFLAQLVSQAAPTYLYDLVLLGTTDTLETGPSSRPYVGIISEQAGFTVVEVSVEEQSVRVTERLTAEAVACRLAAYPPTDPLFYVPSATEYADNSGDSTRSLPFLPSKSNTGGQSRVRMSVVPPSLVPEPMPGVCAQERAKNAILFALLRAVERIDDGIQETLVDDFTLVSPSLEEGTWTQTHPLYVETALQLGLMNDPAIPSLINYVLPHSAPAATRRFWRRWLLNPPPPTVADSTQALVAFFMDSDQSMPSLSVPPLGRVLSLLRAGQASAQVYAELLKTLYGTLQVLDSFEKSDGDTLKCFMTILKHESGLAADPTSLRQRCMDTMELVEASISPIHHARNTGDTMCCDSFCDFGSVVPSAFFERNEATWRGRVRREVSRQTYDAVEQSAVRLARAVAKDFWKKSVEDVQAEVSPKSPIVQDVFNNLIALKEIPAACTTESEKAKYFHPRDRNGKLLKSRYTTEDVQSAHSDYVAACEQACADVANILLKLSRQLFDGGHIPAVVQASHSNLIVSSTFYHAVRARSLGWNVVDMVDRDDGCSDSAGQFQGLWPYWMSRSEAVANSFELKGMWLLTAPNMSGKVSLSSIV